VTMKCVHSCLIVLVLTSIVVGEVVKHPFEVRSQVRRQWNDPADSSFSHSSIRGVGFDSILRGESCPCASIFLPTEYTGDSIPQAAKEVIEYVQCVYSCLVDLEPNSIQVLVNNTQQDEGILAAGGPTIVSLSNDVSPVLYPCPLLQDINGEKCSDVIGPDMQLLFDPNAENYYYGLDGQSGPNQFDFVSILLHEFMHMFGFVGFVTSTGYDSAIAPFVYLFDFGIRYDVEDSFGFPYTTNPPSSSTIARQATTSGSLFFQGDEFRNGKLWAPDVFSPGSSIYHWDEIEYPAGNINSLMTPLVSNGEVIHIIGPLACDVLQTLGYTLNNEGLCSSDVTSATPSPNPAVSPSPSRSVASAPSPSRTRSPTRTQQQNDSSSSFSSSSSSDTSRSSDTSSSDFFSFLSFFSSSSDSSSSANSPSPSNNANLLTSTFVLVFVFLALLQ